jgi:formate-dependent nitrite reductase membrane component NrfD
VLSYAGAILALATAAYTGMLLSVVQAVPFWNSYLMPVIFVVSALSTGLSLTSLLAHFLEKSQAHGMRVSQVHLWLVSAEIIVVAAFFVLIYSGNQGVAKLSANYLLTGSLALSFWLLFVIVGLIGPLIFYVQQSLSHKNTTPLLMKEQDLSQHEDKLEYAKLRVAGSGKSQTILLLCDGAVMVGGLTLRCLIVFAALPAWNGFLS